MRYVFVFTILLSLIIDGCSRKKPCEAVTPSIRAQQLGLVLDGGRVCQDESLIITIDYPEIEGAQALSARYQSHLGSQGWEVSPGAGEGTMTAARGQETIVVVATDNRDRGVPTAIIRY